MVELESVLLPPRLVIVLAGLSFVSGFPSPIPRQKRVKVYGERLGLLPPISIATVSLKVWTVNS